MVLSCKLPFCKAIVIHTSAVFYLHAFYRAFVLYMTLSITHYSIMWQLQSLVVAGSLDSINYSVMFNEVYHVSMYG